MDDIKTPENAGKTTANKSFPAFFQTARFSLKLPQYKIQNRGKCDHIKEIITTQSTKACGKNHNPRFSLLPDPLDSKKNKRQIDHSIQKKRVFDRPQCKPTEHIKKGTYKRIFLIPFFPFAKHKKAIPETYRRSATKTAYRSSILFFPVKKTASRENGSPNP